MTLKQEHRVGEFSKLPLVCYERKRLCVVEPIDLRIVFNPSSYSMRDDKDSFSMPKKEIGRPDPPFFLQIRQLTEVFRILPAFSHGSFNIKRRELLASWDEPFCGDSNGGHLDIKKGIRRISDNSD